jgi:hypothetical protein
MNRSLRSLIAAAACFFTLHGLPAHAQVLALTHFGRVTANDTTPSAGFNNLVRRASRFTLTQPGTATELCIYVDGKGGGEGSGADSPQYFQLALYADLNGKPAKLLGMSYQQQFIYKGAAASWLCQLIDPIAYLPAGSYWVGLLVNGFQSNIIRTYSTSSGQNSYSATDHPGNADAIPEDMFDNGNGSVETGTMAVYARYYPESQLRVAGRTSVGTLASQAMTPNYKRVSRFDLPVRAKVYAISHYLDSLGAPAYDGPPLGQSFRTVIYKDSNGVPGELVYEDGADDNLDVFRPARWYSTLLVSSPYTPPITFEAGRYWIGFLSADPTGDPEAEHPNILRYYYDHTGHWYGNANSFRDQASSPFGPGTAKNDRISAFIHYRPTSATDSIGRTDAAADPSRALTPDVMRWSEFPWVEGASTLTGLHAYLDGKGATSGSQDVRMVIYAVKYVTNQQGSTTSSWALVAKSDVVRIAAGMSARWVDFRVPEVALDPHPGTSVRIGIQSGGPVGVARDYGDNRRASTYANGTRSDVFADGPDAELPNSMPTQLPVTLSVYATFEGR